MCLYHIPGVKSSLHISCDMTFDTSSPRHPPELVCVLKFIQHSYSSPVQTTPSLYDPWGRPGAGAPLRDEQGQPKVTLHGALLREQRNTQEHLLVGLGTGGRQAREVTPIIRKENVSDVSTRFTQPKLSPLGMCVPFTIFLAPPPPPLPPTTFIDHSSLFLLPRTVAPLSTSITWSWWSRLSRGSRD